VVFYEREDVGTLLPQAIWGVGVHGTGGVRVLRGASASQAQASPEKEGRFLMEKDIKRFKDKYNAIIQMLEAHTESIEEDEWTDLFGAIEILINAMRFTSPPNTPKDFIDSATMVTMFLLGRAYERGDEALADFLADEDAQAVGKRVLQQVKDRVRLGLDD